MKDVLSLVLAVVLSVSPAMSFEPATITVKVKIDHSPENRKLVWSLVGEDFGTSSQRDLEGEDSPKTLFLPAWKDVPGGDYIATATVYDSSGKKVGSDSKKVHVEGRGNQ